ncbi:MAG: Lpg1974 family pore-forming outer membrane protein [Rhabdochlamydiaceae bacterium]
MKLAYKILPSLALTFGLSQSLLQADVIGAEQPILMKEAPANGLMGTNDYNAPSAKPYWQDVNGHMHPMNAPFFDAELLVWWANAQGLNGGVVNNNYSPSTTIPQQASTLTYAENHSPHFSWDAGFRLGMGYALDHDTWDLYSSWTRFHTHANTALNAISTSQVLYPSLSAVNADTSIGDLRADRAHGSWKIDTDFVDVELGRQFFAGHYLSLRPHVGLRGAWVNHHHQIKYYNLVNSTTGGTTIPVDVLSLKSRFDGAGLRAGIDSEWTMGHGVSIYGDLAFSALYGRYRNHQFEAMGALDLATASNTYLNYKDRYNDTNLLADIGLGLNWVPDLTCVCPTMRFTLSLGWEHHLILNQVQFKKVSTYTSQQGVKSSYLGQIVSDLALQGLTIGGRLEF